MSAFSDYDPQDVNNFLKSQSKKSRRKACYPCHVRKVGCEGGRPCQRCVDRQHPDLCGYEPGPLQGKKRTADDVGAGESDRAYRTFSQRRKSIEVAHKEDNLTNVRTNLPSTQSTEQAVHPARGIKPGSWTDPAPRSEGSLGNSSFPGFVLNRAHSVNLNRSESDHSELKNLLLPALGLQGNGNANVVAQAPQQSTCVQRALELSSRGSEVGGLTFQWYKDFVFPFNPHPIDITSFEAELVAFLRDVESIKEGQIEAPSRMWLARLFAILAAGTQFSHHPFDNRTAASKSYSYEAFALLHAEYGFITPDLPTVHTLIILITVLQNSLEAEVAWSYVGLASRLAQSIGLDRESATMHTDPSTSELNTWQAIVWQDCLLSACLGRRPCTLSNAKPTQDRGEGSTSLTYHRAMYELAASSLEYVNEYNATPTCTPSPSGTLEYAARLQRLLERVRPGMQSKESGTSIADNTERLAFQLNLSYSLATLLRPAFEEDPHWLASPGQRAKAQRMCIDACTAAVDSFVHLYLVSLVAERSWAFMHNALSCALMLALLDEGSRSEKIRHLQKKLLDVVSRSSSDADRASPLWGPHARILAVFNWLASTRPEKSLAATDSQVTNNPGRAEQEILQDQESDSSRMLPFDSVVTGMNWPQDGFPLSEYLPDLPNLDLGEDNGLIGMYDSILWGGNRNDSNFM